MKDRDFCPECESNDTEFVQFATGEEEAVETQPESVDNGLLELRFCNDCGTGIEIVLEAKKRLAVPHK